MQKIFSPDNRYSTWRKLWVALAESERELGLNITTGQIDELKAHIYDINYDAESKYERELRHDVMAHVYAYGDLCPNARPIIHLGATSCYVTDPADILLLREGLPEIKTPPPRTLPKSTRACPYSLTRIFRRRNPPRSVNAPRCGSTISSKTYVGSTSNSTILNFSAVKALRVRARVFFNFLTTKTRCSTLKS